MIRRALSLPIALIHALAALTALPSTAVAADKDCGDFDTQAAAQKFYVAPWSASPASAMPTTGRGGWRGARTACGAGQT